jgi:hypothetical protein
MELPYDVAAELLLEGVDPEQSFVVVPVVPASEVEEWDTGILVTDEVMPMQVAIRPTDHVPCRGVVVLAEGRG